MSFITGLTRMWLTRTAKPFTFKNGYDHTLPYAECENLGLYVHIPFCKSICNFCPYCKVRYSAELCDRYIDSLIQEIHIVGSQHAEHRKATSLYFGGGTPALAANRIKEIVNALSEHFIITEGIGLELHPDNVNVETVVLLSHKKPDGHINVKVEFGEGEGKVPLDNIAKRAEEYKPKERVTYKMIKEYIEAKYGFKVHTAYIAEVKRDLGLPMYDAPNAVEELKQPRKHPTAEKVEAIKDALKHFEVI